MKITNYIINDEIVCNLTKTIGYDMKTMHIHDKYEIYMAVSNDVKFFVNDRMYLLNSGDIMLFTNKDLHKVSVPDGKLYERYVITFNPSIVKVNLDGEENLLSCFDTEDKKFVLKEEEKDKFIYLADRMRYIKGDEPFSKTEKSLNLFRILLMLCKLSKSKRKNKKPENIGNPYVKTVIKYIDENYMYDITLDKLSSLCYVNKSYLCRIFKQSTGFKIYDYVIYRRLSCAMEKLREGKSVVEASRLSGFSSDTFFITVFKKNIGYTPYKYALKFKSLTKV